MMQENNRLQTRVKRIAGVADAIGKSYSATRLSTIAMNTINLNDNDFERLAAHMENNSRFLPLPPEWQSAASELRLRAESRIYEKCDYCNGKGWGDAIFLGSLFKKEFDGNGWPKEVQKNISDKFYYVKRKDAMGNSWPMIHAIRCKCNAGANVGNGPRFNDFYANYYYLLKSKDLPHADRRLDVILKEYERSM